VVGDIKFGDRGEWAERACSISSIKTSSATTFEQFKQAGKQVILYPPRFKSGELKAPFVSMKN